MKSIYIPAVMFQLLLHVVDAKHCTFIYETGYMKYFFCNAFEYCCGAMCCRSQAVTFYQVWYFWLIVFLTLLICSGGSWWYRFHHGPFINPVTTSPITVATSGRPTIQPAGMMYGPSAHTSHISYPVQQQQVVMPPQSQPPFPKTTAPPPTSPPPYYEAPPSYAAATMQTN